ncbi:MAG TPA: hypothetical protein VJQ82_20865 [Terriglobales bacterium]|nr:hypothetical protein [Terriglobales bacterium]
MEITPDSILVFEAQKAVTGANIHVVQKALQWYLHWCEVGNESAAHVAAQTLQQEIVKGSLKLKAS